MAVTLAYDTIVIGGGAAGLMCALTAGQRGRRVLLIEHGNRVGKKILMSGGGRCNFTNTGTTPANFLSAPHRQCGHISPPELSPPAPHPAEWYAHRPM